MDALATFFDDLKKSGVAGGNFLGFLHALIGRPITRVQDKITISKGMTWREPPILDDPSEIRRVHGRRLELHYDGSRLRIVAWRTKHAVYWVSNTLTQSLSKDQMLGIAASLRRLGQK